MAKNNVSEASITAESNTAVTSAEAARKRFVRFLKGQDVVPIKIPPLYKPYFGRVMVVTIQGASIAIPCDGKTYYVPESFAEEIEIRIDNQDELIEKKNRLSDVQNNFEVSPGALEIF